MDWVLGNYFFRTKSIGNKREGVMKLSLVLSLIAVVFVTGCVATSVPTVVSKPTPSLPVIAKGNVLGNPKAPLDVELWSTLICPACREFALSYGRELRATYVAQGRVKFIWRNIAINSQSTWAGEAAHCSNEQGRFWELHDFIQDQVRTREMRSFSKEDLKSYAVGTSLDKSRFNICLDGNKYADHVRAESELASRKGIVTIPTLYVNTPGMLGAVTYDQLRRIIEKVSPAPTVAPRPLQRF